MNGFNKGQIRFELIDAHKELLRNEVVLTFENLTLKSLNFRETFSEFPMSVGVTAAPHGFWTIHIQPEHYRAKTISVGVLGGTPVKAPKMNGSDEISPFFLEPARAKPTFPTVNRVFSEPRWELLAGALTRTNLWFNKEEELQELSGSELWGKLRSKKPLLTAGLLNLHARSQAVTLPNGRTVFSHFDELISIRQERLYAMVDAELHKQVMQATQSSNLKQFDPANGSLHKFPEGFQRLKKHASFKTPQNAGNLQLTFAQNAAGQFVVDVDIDEAKGINHAFEVINHIFTGSKTHPYDIHQILTYFYEDIDLGYELKPA
jgi:hypothetical protein